MRQLEMARTDPQVNFRIPADLKNTIEQAAFKSHRTVTAEIVARLQQSFDQPLKAPTATESESLTLEEAKRQYHRAQTAVYNSMMQLVAVRGELEDAVRELQLSQQTKTDGDAKAAMATMEKAEKVNRYTQQLTELKLEALGCRSWYESAEKALKDIEPGYFEPWVKTRVTVPVAGSSDTAARERILLVGNLGQPLPPDPPKPPSNKGPVRSRNAKQPR